MMGDNREVLLLLGGNEGDPISTLGRAETMLGERIGSILVKSRDHWTIPWGFTDDRLFLNRALIMETALPDHQLMPVCLQIETELGRVRTRGVVPASRPVDIDVLLIEEEIVEIDGLIVPHPRMHERTFALSPAADIAPQWMHPGRRISVLKMLDMLVRGDQMR